MVVRRTGCHTYNADGTTALVAFDGTGSSEGTDTLTYTYDALGRPDQTKRGSTVLTDNAWNPDDTLASRTDTGVGTSSYAYDWAKRLTGVTTPSAFGGGAIGQSWRLDGLLATRSWPSSVTLAASYDAAKRPTGLSAGSAGSFAQTYDRAGNVTSESRSLTGVSGDAGTGTQSFAYDGLSRLTGSSGLAAGSVAYTYDLDGNRTSVTTGGVTRLAAYDRTDALAAISIGGVPVSATLDALGNLVIDPETGIGTATVAYTYDAADRLTGIDAPGTATDATFGLDALGRHASRTVGGSTETYADAGNSEQVTLIDGTGTDTLALVGPDGSRLAVTDGTTVNWALPDLHGDIAGALAGSTVTSAIRYDGYGVVLDAGSAGGSAVAPGRFGYQGRLDIAPAGSATPLLDAGARFYSPGLGTFMQLDSYPGSALAPASLNRYLYAGANPATLVDPTGHVVLGACSAYADFCNASVSDGTGGTTTRHTVNTTTCWSGCASHAAPKLVTETTAVSTPAYHPASDWLQEDYKTYLRSNEYLYRDKALLTEWGCTASTGECIYNLVNWYSFTFGTAAQAASLLDGAISGIGRLASIRPTAVEDVPFSGIGRASEGDRVVAGSPLATGPRFAAGSLARETEGFGWGELGAGACSFSPDTPVATPGGEVPIGRLKVGDTVLAADPDTGETHARAVDAVLIHDDPITGVVTIDGEPIATTPEHPFFSLDRGFVAAVELVPGELVATAQGDPGRVDAVSWDGGPARMWNLTVAGDHTFFVGEGRWWVHNACGGLGPVTKGTNGVDATIADLQQAGWTQIQTEVMLEAPGIGRSRVDIVARRPDGTFVAIEVKTGPTAGLNRNQEWVLEAIQSSGGGIPRGANALKAFRSGGVTGQFQPMDVVVVYRP